MTPATANIEALSDDLGKTLVSFERAVNSAKALSARVRQLEGENAKLFRALQLASDIIHAAMKIDGELADESELEAIYAALRVTKP